MERNTHLKSLICPEGKFAGLWPQSTQMIHLQALAVTPPSPRTDAGRSSHIASHTSAPHNQRPACGSASTALRTGQRAPACPLTRPQLQNPAFYTERSEAERGRGAARRSSQRGGRLPSAWWCAPWWHRPHPSSPARPGLRPAICSGRLPPRRKSREMLAGRSGVVPRPPFWARASALRGSAVRATAPTEAPSSRHIRAHCWKVWRQICPALIHEVKLKWSCLLYTQNFTSREDEAHHCWGHQVSVGAPLQPAPSREPVVEVHTAPACTSPLLQIARSSMNKSWVLGPL